MSASSIGPTQEQGIDPISAEGRVARPRPLPTDPETVASPEALRELASEVRRDAVTDTLGYLLRSDTRQHGE